GKAVAFGEALQPEFKDYAKKIVANCRALAEGLMEGGINLVSGGTDNHLVLVDLRNADTNGAELEEKLESVGVTCNKNIVPNDPEPPTITSGVRLGTPAMTTRGMGEEEMREIADIIVRAAGGESEGLRARVSALTEAFPLYTETAYKS
ncbi:MAG: serine hydroxymethyltransferase, partial [Actinomycetota bacterium]|nr:serine hydroxymethyltransferase [Actinomycetota bacterium]